MGEVQRLNNGIPPVNAGLPDVQKPQNEVDNKTKKASKEAIDNLKKDQENAPTSACSRCWKNFTEKLKYYLRKIFCCICDKFKKNKETEPKKPVFPGTDELIKKAKDFAKAEYSKGEKPDTKAEKELVENIQNIVRDKEFKKDPEAYFKELGKDGGTPELQPIKVQTLSFLRGEIVHFKKEKQKFEEQKKAEEQKKLEEQKKKQEKDNKPAADDKSKELPNQGEPKPDQQKTAQQPDLSGKKQSEAQQPNIASKPLPQVPPKKFEEGKENTADNESNTGMPVKPQRPPRPDHKTPSAPAKTTTASAINDSLDSPPKPTYNPPTPPQVKQTSGPTAKPETSGEPQLPPAPPKLDASLTQDIPPVDIPPPPNDIPPPPANFLPPPPVQQQIPPKTEARSDLLASIQKGTTLKKTKTKEPLTPQQLHEEEEKRKSNGGGNTMMAEMLAKRSNLVGKQALPPAKGAQPKQAIGPQAPLKKVGQAAQGLPRPDAPVPAVKVALRPTPSKQTAQPPKKEESELDTVFNKKRNSTTSNDKK